MLNDVRYAWRQLRRTPGFTSVAVFTLALGIGANTLFFGLIDAAVWRPLRAIDLADTYDVQLARPPRPRAPGERGFVGWSQRSLTWEQLEHLKAVPQLGIVAVAGVSGRLVTAKAPFDAGRLGMKITRGDYAGVTRMRPILGQLAGLSGEGPGTGAQVVISERIWRLWFRADPAVAGRDTIRINRVAFTVAGVVPAAQSYEGTDIWVAAENWRAADPTMRDGFASSRVRFRPGGEPVRLTAIIDHALASGPTPPPPEFKARFGASVAALAQVSTQRLTWLVMALSVLVLCAACANLANMLGARAEGRTGEIAVRLSLGASAAGVFRLFVVEATIIAGIAAAAGAALAWLGLRYVGAVLPGATLDRYTRVPLDISPDWRMFAYAMGAGACAALVVGGVTAWRGSRTPPLRLLGSSGIAQGAVGRGNWARTAFVAVQVSAAVVLVLGTGLYLIRALTDAPAAVTFETSRLAAAQIEFDFDRFNTTQMPEVLQRIVTSVERLEGIDAGAIADGMFGTASQVTEMLSLTAEHDSEPGTLSRRRLLTGLQVAVSPGFLDVLGLKLLSGRNLFSSDVEAAVEVVLLSESAARTLWPDLDPLGRRVRIAGDRRWFTVVGTFEDPMRQGSDASRTCSPCVALTSWAQVRISGRRGWLVVLRSGTPEVAVKQVRPLVDAINPDVPVFNAAVADRSIFAVTNAATAFSGLVGTLGLVSLAIAALGVYGVISYTVSRRSREFGIRLALGATPSRIVRAVVDDAVHLVLVGLLPGVLLASWATRAFEARIVNLMPNDIPTWFAVPLLILMIGIVAAWIPARRASRVDPNVALRDL